jgi:hypothetical protein
MVVDRYYDDILGGFYACRINPLLLRNQESLAVLCVFSAVG